MTAAQTKALIVTTGVVFAGISGSLEQAGTLPHAWAWVIPVLAWLGGYLKGGALMQRPGDTVATADSGALPKN